MKFENKVVIITGASQGIGRAINDAFRAEGAKTAVIDLTDQNTPCDFFYQGDLTEEAVLTDFVHQVTERFGHVDYLINNAMMTRLGILSGCSYEDFLYAQKVGVAAPYYLTKLLLPHFAPGAAIVNMSSTRAFQSQEDTESYSAAKGGITALTHALAVSLSGRVRVNSISPGWIDTTGSEFHGADNTQHPSGRVGKPMDIASMVLYLCSKEAGFINGENIRIDGGMTRLMVYHADYGWTYEG
ncbi:MAG: SDR family oxidoreductase [Ruminococcaceae bacterium]|nr:SDR family oxidoreductase [Oscillospiraceae bacterium]